MTTNPHADQALPADVVAAIQQGNKIEAIKRLRLARGLDLKDAKDIVDAYVRADPALARKYQAHAERARRVAWFIFLAASALMFWYWLSQ